MELSKKQIEFLDKHRMDLMIIKDQVKHSFSEKEAKELLNYLSEWFKSKEWKL